MRRRGGLADLECVHAVYEHAGPIADAVHTRPAFHRLPGSWKAVALDRMARIVRTGVLRLRDLIFDFQPAEADAVLGRRSDGAADDPALGQHPRGPRRASAHRLQHPRVAS